jgi:uncharacterized protein (DUF302 family)
MNSEGLIDLPSPYSAQETADRLENLFRQNGLKIFARIDQDAEAAAVGLSLRPTILFLFGDPKAGTPLMEQFPGLAIDLPLKALVWQSDDGKVYLSYTSPEFLKERHHLPSLPFAQLPGLLAKSLE